MSQVTRILEAIAEGDATAAQDLLPLVYDQLRQLAAVKLSCEKPGQTLQATALVHEAYLRLVDAEGTSSWNSRGHFFSAAAEAMRRILVENARRKHTLKAGGGRGNRVDLTDAANEVVDDQLDLITLSEAIDKLAAKHPRKAELLKLRFFAGLTNRQAAKALGISTSSADNDWVYAKTWLRVQMSK